MEQSFCLPSHPTINCNSKPWPPLKASPHRQPAAGHTKINLHTYNSQNSNHEAQNENSHETTPHSGPCVSPGISSSWFLPPEEKGRTNTKAGFFQSRNFLKIRHGHSCAQKDSYMLNAYRCLQQFEFYMHISHGQSDAHSNALFLFPRKTLLPPPCPEPRNFPFSVPTAFAPLLKGVWSNLNDRTKYISFSFVFYNNIKSFSPYCQIFSPSTLVESKYFNWVYPHCPWKAQPESYTTFCEGITFGDLSGCDYSLYWPSTNYTHQKPKEAEMNNSTCRETIFYGSPGASSHGYHPTSHMVRKQVCSVPAAATAT